MKCLRRLQSELRLFQRKQQLPNLVLLPSDDNLLLWYFAFQNLNEPYTNGQYLGQIRIPEEYPFQQPTIVLLTPNGRFPIGESICVYTKQWSPRWNLQVLLMSFLNLFLTDHENDYESGFPVSTMERERLADESQQYNETHYPEILQLLKIIKDDDEDNIPRKKYVEL